MDLIIREFTENDAKAVSIVGTKAWFHTYSHIFSQDLIEQRMNRSYNPESIKLSAQSSQYTQMFVAEIKGIIIGFSQPSYYNYWDPDTYDPNRMMISRIYLLPEYIGKGIGSKLLTKSEEWIQAKGFNKYYLYVHKDNKIGLNFYMRQGFTLVEQANEDDEILIKKHITSS
ncbi:MAG: N-acetyltransferase family protein [Candidatus Kariarchaeaceae archaeon]|jgi:ribosomal protein S18 acetylase RimI-like enzyme